jgi:hypothetical protein
MNECIVLTNLAERAKEMSKKDMLEFIGKVTWVKEVLKMKQMALKSDLVALFAADLECSCNPSVLDEALLCAECVVLETEDDELVFVSQQRHFEIHCEFKSQLVEVGRFEADEDELWFALESIQEAMQAVWDVSPSEEQKVELSRAYSGLVQAEAALTNLCHSIEEAA